MMDLKNTGRLLLLVLALGLWACGSEGEQGETAEASPLAADPGLEQVNRQIQENPEDASLYAARARLLLDQGAIDEAIADLQTAIQKDSLNPDYYHALADVYLDYFKSQQALETMVQAGNRFPKRIPTLLKLAEFQLILKLYNEALFTLERIRQIDPLNAEMFFMFGKVFEEKGDLDRAIEGYQRAVENDPDLIDAWIKLGNLWMDRGEPIAEKFFDNALRVDSNHIEALKAKAYYLANVKDDLEGAARLYRKINVLDPQNEEGYYNIGLLYLDMDSLNRAYQSFDLAIKMDPTFVMGYYYRGVAAELKGDLQQARTDYENALKFAPDFERAREALDRLQQQ